MKRKYETPKAEKVVFDYTETVVACSNIGWCGWCFWFPPKQNTQPQETEVIKPPKTNTNPFWAAGWGLHCS